MLFRFLILVHVCAAFPLKCPEPAQWSTRARGFCPDPSKYFCLKNDLINGYSENCTIFDFLKPGRKHVLRGGLDADICSLERYQPWPITFYTNVSTNCIFRKSACNEQGQVIYDNGNRNTDITCRCDYTKGFDFIVKPRNRCFCVPSEEDCSCYLKMCQDSRYTLSPDYGCVHPKKNISINQCKPIFFERINRESNQSDFEDILRIQNISTAERYLTTVAILVTISLAVLFLSYPLAKVFASCYIEHNYFSKELSMNPEELIEGKDVSISCEIIHKNMGGTWYKNGNPVSLTDRIEHDIDEKIHTLTIRNAELSDSAVYCIDFNGVKREIQLHVKAKYNIPLEIQKMTDLEKEKYIKILQEGNEKRYHIKIMILGRQGVGKSSLMRRLLKESTNDVISTDGIDIVRRCKVDIESKDWIFCQDDSTADVNERIGRALRQTDKSDSLDRNKKNNDAHVQNGQSTANPSSDIQTEGDKERSKHLRSDFFKTPGIDNDKKDTNNVAESQRVTKKDNTTEIVINDKEEKSNKQENENENQKVPEIVKPRNTENIEAVLEIGCTTKVSGRVLADCIIMDFAGHKEYYSTHQTFLTTNAIYLVVFKFDDDDPFADTLEETEQLGFWVDNIHCYAQTGQDIKDGVANPPIIMMCTKADAPEDPDSVKTKMKWQEIFKNWMKINQRNSHIRGPINYISNTNSSENTFNELRKTIVNIAENLSIWGEHYPVRWINLERALNQKRSKEQVLSLKNVMDLAEICSVPISDKNEVILFLKYQHEIGNLIFYDDLNLKDCVILNPSWLVDAFKCLICATEFQQFSDNTHSDELLILEHNGEISLDLCQKLFRKKSTEHANHSELVLQVMEKFDIIVKDKSNKYNFICPGGIKRKWSSTDITTFEDICKEHLIDTKTLSPWLCIEFDFLPPALYNHLLVLCMRDSKFEKIKLYPGIGIFRILDVEDRNQLVVCELTNKIILQRVHPGSEHYNSSGQKNETIPNGQDVFNNISSKIRGILTKYKMSLKCTYLIKCGVAPDDIPDYLYSEEYIKKYPKRWCNLHKASHNLDNLLKFWLDRSSPEFIPIYVDEKDVQELFKRPLANVTVMEGTDTKFECETKEENGPVEWFKDGDRLTHNGINIKIETLPGYIYTLTISNARFQDSGKYSIKKKGIYSEAILHVKEMNKLKYTQKYATATCITPTGQLEEVKVPAVQVTPLDGKVYRLLRPNECVKDGISAKSKGSNVTAAYHVAWGSTIKKLDSKYISTFRQLDDAISISSKNEWLNGDIVSINVDKAPVTVIHVWDADVRRQLILEQNISDLQTIYNFNKFAKYNNEVLLVGDVPADCIEIERDKQSLPNCVGNIAV